MIKIKTSQKILNCATRLFAQSGYDGTIMDDLAEKCGANKASIYYHHKDKATLYENALVALFTPIADAVIDAADSEDDPILKLRCHIKAFANASAENPYFASILMREMASGGVHMPTPAKKQMQRILLSLKTTLQLGESKKIFIPADPLLIHFMIVGTLNLFVASASLRSSLPETDPCNPPNSSGIEPASEQISKTIISSLLAK